MDSGVNFGAAVGTALTEQIDIELEGIYNEANYSGYPSELRSLSIMANGYYNFPIYQSLSGYVGVGVGAMRVTYEWPSTGDESDWVAAYQAVAGIRYPLSEKLSAFVEYRYLAAFDDAELKGYGVDVEFKTNDISAGLRFSF
jgi:opacity protein-like surface antigen